VTGLFLSLKNLLPTIMAEHDKALNLSSFACHRQHGQALIYGLFVLTGALAALFFMFNSGQLIEEKTKLVNTADTAAYSAGIMYARALNFDAYTNRAMMANEVMVAQAISVASWTAYILEHTKHVAPLACLSAYTSEPLRNGMLDYAAVCALLSMPAMAVTADSINTGAQYIAPAVVAASEVAKGILQLSQTSMAAAFVPAPRQLLHRVLQQVADANYLGDGTVKVDTLPLTDNFILFEGQPFIHLYSGDERSRFKEATVTAANKDGFIKQRSWTSNNPINNCLLGKKEEFRRRGGTELIGFDEWKALDTASLHRFSWHTGFFSSGCRETEQALAYAAQAASKGSAPDDSNAQYGNATQDNPVARGMASASSFPYTGLPTFYDLSAPGLHYHETDPDLEKHNPRLKFAIRLTRSKSQTRTSEGTSTIRPAGRLQLNQATLSSDVLSAVATSEVFFNRFEARSDGKTELASLFNPYWQVHLIPTSAADIALAIALPP